MNFSRAIVRVIDVMLLPSLCMSQNKIGTAVEEQSSFSYEIEVLPVQKPVGLPAAALQVLAKDGHVRSCLESQELTAEGLPANWFIASQIHLDGANETDLILLPSGRLPDTPEGDISANACLAGPYTGGVLGIETEFKRI